MVETYEWWTALSLYHFSPVATSRFDPILIWGVYINARFYAKAIHAACD